jgi:hypothetical protein
MAAAPLLGKILGNAGKGSADQRGAENTQTAQRNALLAQLYGMQQNATGDALRGQSAENMAHANLDMDRKKFALTAPSVRANQSVRGSILQNAQPVTLSGLPERVASRVPQISGGLTPAMFNADTRALGGELTRKALIDQLAGDNFDPMVKTDFKSGILPQPNLEEYQKSGLLEQILGGGGLVGSILGGIGEASDEWRKRRAPLDNPFEQAG